MSNSDEHVLAVKVMSNHFALHFSLVVSDVDPLARAELDFVDTLEARPDQVGAGKLKDFVG